MHLEQTRPHLPCFRNILPVMLPFFPEGLCLLEIEISLCNSNVDESGLDAFAHALATAANEYSPIQSIDNEPDKVGLCSDLILHVFRFALPALDDLLHLVFMHSPVSG